MVAAWSLAPQAPPPVDSDDDDDDDDDDSDDAPAPVVKKAPAKAAPAKVRRQYARRPTAPLAPATRPAEHACMGQYVRQLQ
jgi:hypothetical protein